MPLAWLLGLFAVEVAILTGGLTWTFRRANLPVGWRGALGLALVVAVAQLLVGAVVQAGVDLGAGREPLALVWSGWRHPVHEGAVTAALASLVVAAPLALQRFLRLDARWTRALSGELLAGVIASGFGAVVITGALLLLGLLALGLLRAF